MKLYHLQIFDIEPTSCLRVSAKTGWGLEAVLPAIIEQIPPPNGDETGNLRMLLYDAVHDDYRLVLFFRIYLLPTAAPILTHRLADFSPPSD